MAVTERSGRNPSQRHPNLMTWFNRIRTPICVHCAAELGQISNRERRRCGALVAGLWPWEARPPQRPGQADIDSQI